MIKKYIIEKRELLYEYKGIKIILGYSENDKKHIYNQLKNRTDELSFGQVRKIINRAIDKILDLYSPAMDQIKFKRNITLQFMVFNKRNNIKLPLEIEYDNRLDSIVAIVTTILDKDKHLINKKDEIELLVEKSKNFYFKVKAWKEHGNRKISNHFDIEFDNGQIRELYENLIIG